MFSDWLRTQRDREDEIGDLATDAASDYAFPSGSWRPHAAYADHLERHGKHVLAALDSAWAEWTSSLRVLGSGSSYVYFICNHNGERVKIGVSRDPAKRVAELQTGNPERLSLLLAVPGTAADEALLHMANRDVRISGEWFQQCNQIAEQINSAARALRVMPLRIGPGGPEEMHARALRIERLQWLADAARTALLDGDTSRIPAVKLWLMTSDIVETQPGVVIHEAEGVLQ